MKALSITKKKPTINSINYEHGHNVLSVFAKKNPITLDTYIKIICIQLKVKKIIFDKAKRMSESGHT